MNRVFLALLIVLLGPAVWASAGSDAKPSDDSPKAALKAQDAAAHAANVDHDMSFYQADSDQQKKLARAAAELDVAVARVQKTVEAKFGPDLGAAVVHASGSIGLSDIESANEQVDGSKATIKWKDKRLPLLTMVKADGKWKISLTDMLKDADPAEIDQLITSVQQFASELQKLVPLVEQDKFRSGEGIRDRVEELHDQAFRPRQPA